MYIPQPFNFSLIGAKVDLKYGGIVSLRQTLIRTFGRDILKFERFSLEELAKNVTSDTATYDQVANLEVPKLLKEPIMKCLKLKKRSKLLRLMELSFIGDTFKEFKLELGRAKCAEIIINSPPGDYNLIQFACALNLPRHLASMLEIDGKLIDGLVKKYTYPEFFVRTCILLKYCKILY